MVSLQEAACCCSVSSLGCSVISVVRIVCCYHCRTVERGDRKPSVCIGDLIVGCCILIAFHDGKVILGQTHHVLVAACFRSLRYRFLSFFQDYGCFRCVKPFRCVAAYALLTSVVYLGACVSGNRYCLLVDRQRSVYCFTNNILSCRINFSNCPFWESCRIFSNVCFCCPSCYIWEFNTRRCPSISADTLFLSIISFCIIIGCQCYILIIVEINYICSIFFDNKLFGFTWYWSATFNALRIFCNNCSRFTCKYRFWFCYFICCTIPIIIYSIVQIWTNIFCIEIKVCVFYILREGGYLFTFIAVLTGVPSFKCIFFITNRFFCWIVFLRTCSSLSSHKTFCLYLIKLSSACIQQIIFRSDDFVTNDVYRTVYMISFIVWNLIRNQCHWCNIITGNRHSIFFLYFVLPVFVYFIPRIWILWHTVSSSFTAIWPGNNTCGYIVIAVFLITVKLCIRKVNCTKCTTSSKLLAPLISTIRILIRSRCLQIIKLRRRICT